MRLVQEMGEAVTEGLRGAGLESETEAETETEKDRHRRSQPPSENTHISQV